MRNSKSTKVGLLDFCNLFGEEQELINFADTSGQNPVHQPNFPMVGLKERFRNGIRTEGALVNTYD